MGLALIATVELEIDIGLYFNLMALANNEEVMWDYVFGDHIFD